MGMKSKIKIGHIISQSNLKVLDIKYKQNKSGKNIIYYECECLICGTISDKRSDGLKNKCKHCAEINHGKSGAFKYDIGDIIGSLKILEMTYKAKGKSGKKHKTYKYECLKCGHIDEKIESSILRGSECPCCCQSPQVVVEHINSIVANKETHWMIDYFQGGYDEAKLYTPKSNKRVNFKCPHCDIIKESSVKQLNRNRGLSCVCNDKISYPEKYMISMLSQLNIDYKFQYTKSDEPWVCDYKYDFFFVYNGVKIIIETHGEQHPETKFYRKKSLFSQKDIDVDIKKKILALKNGIDKYITIDCSLSDSDFISSEILKSDLSTILDLDVVDWEECDKFSTKNLIKEICDIKKDNKNISTTEVAKMYKLHTCTISEYWKKGARLGWCNYDIEEDRKRRGYESSQKRKRKIAISKDGILIGIFDSRKDIEIISEEMFGVKLNSGSMMNVLVGKIDTYKGYRFEYADDLL